MKTDHNFFQKMLSYITPVYIGKLRGQNIYLLRGRMRDAAWIDVIGVYDTSCHARHIKYKIPLHFYTSPTSNRTFNETFADFSFKLPDYIQNKNGHYQYYKFIGEDKIKKLKYTIMFHLDMLGDVENA